MNQDKNLTRVIITVKLIRKCIQTSNLTPAQLGTQAYGF